MVRMIVSAQGEYSIPPEWVELDKKLKTGDGLNWPGDSRLWLGVGVITVKKTGRTGHRLEVWRDCEDGRVRMIGSWLPEQAFRVLYDLCAMRVEAPGHVPIDEVIDRHNAKHEAEILRKDVELKADLLEYATKLHKDRTGPRTKFFMNGDRAGRA